MRLDRDASFKVMAEIGWQLNCMLLLILATHTQQAPRSAPEATKIEAVDAEGARAQDERPSIEVEVGELVRVGDRVLGRLEDAATRGALQAALDAIPSDHVLHVRGSGEVRAVLDLVLGLAGRDVAIVQEK